MDRLEAEMRFYHNVYTMAKLYKLDDDTASNEAKGCLQLFVSKCDEFPDLDPREISSVIYEEFESYLKSW